MAQTFNAQHNIAVTDVEQWLRQSQQQVVALA